MAHITRVGVPLGIVAAFAGACGSGDSRQSAGSQATDSATLAASAAASAPLRVSNVMIGRQIGPGNRITDPTFQFAPKDTVHISVATTGTDASAMLTAAWRSQTGEILQKSSEKVLTGENVGFQFSQAKGLRPGTYKVIVFLGEDSVDTKVFVVKK
jgi:hypothetical protein